MPRRCLALALLPLCLTAQAPEVSTQDAPAVFKSTSNLIPVPVVVRDNKGNAVGNLSLEDFQLFDNGKPQLISKFSVEKIEVPATAPPSKTNQPAAAAPAPRATPEAAPDRFVAYVFDDIHMSLGDLVPSRNAAIRQIDSAQHANERAAVYTTSGRQAQEFTADKDKLHAVLNAISPGAEAEKSAWHVSCPPVDFYMGDLIYNRNDLPSLKIATKDALVCMNDPVDDNTDIPDSVISNCLALIGGDSPTCSAVRAAQSAARSSFQMGDRATEISLDVLRAVVKRMTAMPGQRAIVLVSSGFLVLDGRHYEETELIERAIRGNVIIGGLDARGLYTQIPGGDASESGKFSATAMDKIPFQNLESIIQTDIIANLADGTGGTFYHGTNDYDEAFARVAAAPEYKYVLGFSPQNLKLDGSLHTLKVTLRNGHHFELRFRNGYYAASYATTPENKAKQAIEEAFFSRDEIHDLPAILQTQYFSLQNGDATLSAVTKIDVRKLNFRQDAGRNLDDLTVVTGIFDNDGNYISGQQKTLQMKLLDQTLSRLSSGISVKESFSVHPGRYIVRVVVRDAEGQSMAAQSSLVAIPAN